MDIRGSLRRLQDRVLQITPATLTTYLLFCVFGMGSWVALNGIWAEISVLVTTLPECFTLPSILAVAVQVANVGPLTYIIIKYSFQHCSVRTITIETVAVLAIVGIGLVACILLTLMWDRTAVVGGDVHSVALIVLTFGLALVDCTSTLVFIPFMKHFPAQYISALYIGEGLSGVLPSVLALSQGFVNESLVCVGNYTGTEGLDFHVSPSVYIIFLSSLTLLCGLAFIAIVTLPMVRKQILPPTMSVLSRSAPKTSSPVCSLGGSVQVESERETTPLRSSEEEVVEKEDSEKYMSFDQGGEDSTSGEPDSPLIHSGKSRSSGGEEEPFPDPYGDRRGARCCGARVCSASSPSTQLGKLLRVAWSSLPLLVCMLIVNFITNGALPSISAFVFKPYGNTVYHVAINLGILASPLAILLYVLLSYKSRTLVVVLTAISCVLSVYVLVVAVLSPDPPLKDHVIGDLIIVSG